MPTAMPESALVLKNVVKTYGDFRAVDDVSFTVPQGSIYGFLGPNGAGKTTTIRMILEILRPTSGTVSVLGTNALSVRDRIGYLPEEKGLYKKMRTWAVIAYFAMLKGIPRKQARLVAHELLERYGLSDFADKKTEALSKGMGQKVQVLASIAHRPEFVILDEPFSGLDPVNQQVMEEVIRDLNARGTTVIFSTHVMSHAERICEHLVLLAKGRKIFDGSVEAARRTIPRRVKIRSRGDLRPLSELDGVVSMERLDLEEERFPVYDLQITDGFDPQQILKACFEKELTLETFEQTEPSLHDVFVHLVGHEAREATFR
ncbi:MAG: ABC transporter ATP-binding protein [Planctomycetota bacterium]